MLAKNTILLLKAQGPNSHQDKYEALLKSKNFEVRQVKTLDFEFKNLDKLLEKVENYDDYSGIILSSPRCVQAVHMCAFSKSVKAWKSKFNFVVGEATYRDALEKLGMDCRGRDTGNGLTLSKLILEYKPLCAKPFLIPHGNLKSDTINLELEKGGIGVECLEVYDSVVNNKIGHDLAEATQNFQLIPEYVAFFSPSGFYSSIEHLRRLPIDLKEIKFIAIGPVTEMAILESNLPVWGVAKRPNPDDLLDVILNPIQY
ncbi:uroporphyrinogen-III synthase-like [Euwallacea fornicatus]|uniref:uroporphyrinogen-III synthase-like n=1 Tax=Euwallacea fornicatus TaxID=995702 RepID=UPI00338E1AA4